MLIRNKLGQEFLIDEAEYARISKNGEVYEVVTEEVTEETEVVTPKKKKNEIRN